MRRSFFMFSRSHFLAYFFPCMERHDCVLKSVNLLTIYFPKVFCFVFAWSVVRLHPSYAYFIDSKMLSLLKFSLFIFKQRVSVLPFFIFFRTAKALSVLFSQRHRNVVDSKLSIKKSIAIYFFIWPPWNVTPITGEALFWGRSSFLLINTGSVPVI